jgi:hypothetical protein
MKHGNSSEYKCNTIRTTIRSRPRRTEVWSMVIVVNTSVTPVRRSRDRIVVLIVLHLYSLLLPCFILQLGPSWSWSYGRTYCVTLVFTTITILHTSVRRGRHLMVVLIVLHLYSLLLPCFILQLGPSWSWSHSSSYCVTLVKCNTIRTTIRSRPRRTQLKYEVG